MIKEKIKENIKKNKLMKYPLLLRKYIKNCEFKDWVDAYGKPNAIHFHKFGEENPNVNIYYMKFEDSAIGFFAYWKMSIIGLNYAKTYGLQAVINWTQSSPYYEPKLFGVDSNPFDYYFEPINKMSIKSVENSESVVIANITRDRVGFFANALDYDFNNQIEYYVKINKEYFRIKEKLRNSIDIQIRNLFRGKKVLGIHIRGVEWGTIIGHPIPSTLETYYEYIDTAMREHNFECIFIASDSEEAIEKCRNRYGDIIITFEDTLRSKTGSKTLMIFDENITRHNNHYLMGYEVLRDMLALSKCSGLIAGFSNVSLASRVFKESANETYEYLKIIEPSGICDKGLWAAEAVKKMKEGTFK